MTSQQPSSAPLVIHPPEGVCFKSLAGAVHFELKKAVDDRVAFKVLSKFPQIYRVNPNVGVVEGPTGRTKSVSINLNIDGPLTPAEIAGITADVLLVDVIRVADVSCDTNAPPPKKANKSGQTFDWSKVTDKKMVTTLKLKSRLDHSLKTKLTEMAKSNKTTEEQPMQPSANTPEFSNDTPDVNAEIGKRSEASQVGHVSMELNNSQGSQVAVVEGAAEPERQQEQEPEIPPIAVEKGGTVKFVEVEVEEEEEVEVEVEPENRFQKIAPAMDLVNLMEDLRKIEHLEEKAKRFSTQLREESDSQLGPLVAMIPKVYEAFEYRNIVSKDGYFSFTKETAD